MTWNEAGEIEHNTIRELKDELEQGNEVPLVREKMKCHRCGAFHPRLKLMWGNDRDGDPKLLIHFPAPSKEDLEKIFEVEKVLASLGFHFDTGYGGGRDWEFDWSLTGEHLTLNPKNHFNNPDHRGDSWCEVCEDRHGYLEKCPKETVDASGGEVYTE